MTMEPPTTRRRETVRLPAPHVNDKPDVKLGVLLLQLGGPENTEDVEGFLYNLFADPDIIRLPGIISMLQKPLAYVISKRRAPKSKAAYESIGGGSPIVKYTQAQADGVERVLRQEMGLDAKCYVAMRYWHPFTDEALEQMRKDGVNSMVVVPLYPQFSISTSGSSLRVLQDLFFKDFPQWSKVAHTVVPAWYDRPGYIQAMGRLISRELARFTPEQRAAGPLHVLFSAHGVPQRYIEMGDPYQEQIQKCVSLIAKEYSAEVTTHLSYQSRVGPIEWLRPYTDDMLEELGASGVKNLVVVPISFVSEHIETLEEIDIEYRELAEESGILNWRRVPALNTDEGFIEDLAHMVVEALQEPAITVTEACALNNLDIEPLNPPGQEAGEGVNGKLALVGLATSVVLDLLTGKGIPHFIGMH
jgi:ferrochelatase